MKLTILGKYSPFPKAGGACPGYLIEYGDSVLLLECGSGVLSKLQTMKSLFEVKDVVFSHLHFDHMADFLILRYAVATYDRLGQPVNKLNVYAPAQPQLEYSLLEYKDLVNVTGIDKDRQTVFIGELVVKFYAVEHGIPAYAIKICSPEKTLVYSGDTRPCAAIEEAAKGADLFLCESSAAEAEKEFAAAGHLTSAQAGELAAKAGVKRLLLTHIWPFYEEKQLLDEAREEFAQTEVAQEGQVYII
jgi:ribonuclease BN (tRNA processing enzyme)